MPSGTWGSMTEKGESREEKNNKTQTLRVRHSEKQREMQEATHQREASDITCGSVPVIVVSVLDSHIIGCDILILMKVERGVYGAQHSIPFSAVVTSDHNIALHMRLPAEAANKEENDTQREVQRRDQKVRKNAKKRALRATHEEAVLLST